MVRLERGMSGSSSFALLIVEMTEMSVNSCELSSNALDLICLREPNLNDGHLPSIASCITPIALVRPSLCFKK